MATTEQRLATLEKKVTNITNARAKSGFGIVVHGDDPNAPAPLTKYQAVAWIGSVQPKNAQDFDLWYETA